MNEKQVLMKLMIEFANKYGIKALMRTVLTAVEASEGKL